MRLTELEPRFLKILDGKTYRHAGTTIQDDGISFLCPQCFKNNNGSVGTHSIICWRLHVPQTITPIPGRWEMVGTGFEDLTLVAGSSSVKIDGSCNAHFFIRNGEIVFA